MKHKISVAKIIACVLIVLLSMESIMAAPLADNQQQQQQQQQQTEKSCNNHRKNNIKLDVKDWMNPCNAIGMIDSSVSSGPSNPSAAYETTPFFSQLKPAVEQIDIELTNNQKIDTTNYTAWDYFHAHNYKFLPTHPTGNHRKWHFDMQIYVASFSVLLNEQKCLDAEYNDKTISEELQKIFESARHLLCEIEGFVNATSAQKIGSQDWIRRKEMREILTFKNLSDEIKLHRTYVKGRFQSYINRLQKRIKQQSEKNYVEKKINYPKHKALGKNKAGTRRPNKGGRMNKQNKRQQRLQKQQQEQLQQEQQQRQLLNGQNYEVPTTKRVHIVRTSRIPGQPRKNNNNRRRQKTTKAAEMQKQQ